MVCDLLNKYYTYSVTHGKTTKETADVYAKACGVNGQRSMVVDLSTTNPDGWENDKHVLVQNQTDASVWEISVADFSSSESSGVRLTVAITLLLPKKVQQSTVFRVRHQPALTI